MNPMRPRTQQATPGRWVLVFLAALVAVLATTLASASASAATTTAAEPRVGAHNLAVEVLIEPPQQETPGQQLGKDAAGHQIVVATRVAANPGGSFLDDAARAEQHLTRLDHSPANDAMLARIRSAAADSRPLHESESNFLRHELTEADLIDGGMGYPEAHGLAGQTHPTFGNYTPL